MTGNNICIRSYRMFEKICFAIQNKRYVCVCVCECRITKHFSLISEKRDNNPVGERKFLLYYKIFHRLFAGRCMWQCFVLCNNEKILPLSIWWVIAPFIASTLASNWRSSSFSFLPKKTMIATFSLVCPEYKTDSFSIR